MKRNISPTLGGGEFREIDWFPGYYVGKDGTVVSTRKGKPHKLRIDYNSDGYCRVRLFNKYGRYNYFVHRIVAEAFIPKREDDKIVDHLDTDIENNHADNLRWCRNMKENLANPNSQKKRELARNSLRAKRRRALEEAVRQAAVECPF